jgi:hypothetical protein
MSEPINETETTTETTAAAAPPPAANTLVADPDPGYRWKHLIMAALMIAGGFWFAYDGWVRWPAENARAAQVQRDLEAAKQQRAEQTKIDSLAAELGRISKHTELDLLIQKILAFALPAFGLFWGGWTLWETRGHYEMAGDVLHVPGHPPVTYDDIRRIDKRKWDRKGVAFVHYDHGNPPKPGILKLDDFAYDRTGTDAILERIERNVIPAESTPAPRNA